MKICAFTGPEPKVLPYLSDEREERCIALKQLLHKLVYQLSEEETAIRFMSGMALGADTFAAEAILSARKTNPKIELECVIPYETQAINWKERDRDRYFDIIAQCTKETMLQGHYTPGCIEKSKRYMVDQADVLVAVWDGSLGETGRTVLYAKNKGKRVIIIHPDTLALRPDDNIVPLPLAVLSCSC